MMRSTWLWLAKLGSRLAAVTIGLLALNSLFGCGVPDQYSTAFLLACLAGFWWRESRRLK